MDADPVPTAGELLRDNLHRRVQGMDRALAGLAHPSRTLPARQPPAKTWREFFAEQRAPHQPQPSDRDRPPAGHRRQPP